MANKRIGLRDVRALVENTIVWDSAVPGFGARRQKSAAVAYVLKFRTATGRQRWFSIGRHGAPWTPEQAREEARRLLGEVARKGDPAADKAAARHAATVTELCDLYLADALAGRLLTRANGAKSPSTLATDRGRIEGHIKPLLGRMAVASVTTQDVEAFLHDVAAGKTARKGKTARRKATNIRGGKGAATRTVGLLGAIFGYAVRHRMRADNPVRGVRRFADGRRERRLNEKEYAALGSALKTADKKGLQPIVTAAVRFLALTGWRRGEVVGLRWDEVDLSKRTALLAQTKTGRSMRPLSRAVCDLLSDLPKDSEFVFPSADGKSGLRGLPHIWSRKLAPIDGFPKGVTPHSLRHSFASVANDLGFSEPSIGTLIGHKGRSITSRYVHSADTVLLAAADGVADRICELMAETKRKADVVVLRRAER